MHISDLPQLRTRLSGPLPGWEAQKTMSSIGYDKFRIPKEDSKLAAVLALLYPDAEGELNLIYIKRPSNNPHDKHGGQISFPGGRREGEEEMMDAATRECEEEIGVPVKDIEVLAPLSSVYVFVSDFNVFPFVGFVHELPSMTRQESEVEEILTVKVADLIAQEKKWTDLVVRGNTKLKNVPYYDVDGHVLWGATAMITAELLELISYSRN